jgi:hypothetical protein
MLKTAPAFSVRRCTLLAIVFQHSLDGQLATTELTSNRCEGFHPAPILITSCLGDTSLPSPHPTVHNGPVRLVPFACVGRGRRIRVHGSHLACLLLRGFGIRFRRSTPRGSQRPFRVEHVVSYPSRYSPAFAFSALRCPLPIHTLCSLLTRPTHPGREDNGFTEFHGDDTVGWVLPIYRRCCVSVSRDLSETSDRVPFWLRRIQLVSPVVSYDSYGSSPEFTRPPSLAPRPPVAGRVRNRSSRIDSAACAGVRCPGALDGSSRNPP